MTKKKQDKIVSILWVDSCFDNGWNDRDHMKTHTFSSCRTVGFLGRSDRNQVTVYQSKSEDTGQVGDVMSIPRCSIKKITQLGTMGGEYESRLSG